MSLPVVIAYTSCGVFMLIALACGYLKYHHIRQSPTATAPRYVNVAHNAGLHYTFACLVVARFVEISDINESVALLALAMQLPFFFIAQFVYIHLAFTKQRESQYKDASAVKHGGTYLLAFSEIGGFLILFVAFLMQHVFI